MPTPEERSETLRRPYRGVAPETRDAARRERLLVAAFTLYTARRSGDVPVALICRTAQVTTRQFYEVFSDREALFEAVYEQAAELCLAAVVRAITGHEDLAGAIRAMLERLFKSDTSTDLGKAFFVLFSLGAMSTTLRQRRVESIEIAAHRLAALLGEMDARWGNRLRCSIFIAAVVQMLEVAWLDSGLAQPDEIIDQLLEIFVEP